MNFDCHFPVEELKRQIMKARIACATLMLLAATTCVAGLRLPEPPRQHADWHPDADIPTNILSAVETIYAQGFPDPRGCDYRNIEVAVSGVWDGKVSMVKTRGWVLPEKSGTNQFAICWNGLIYPVATVSAPADLHAETTNLASGVRYGMRGNSAAGESQTILFGGALSTRVFLLLRCGETAAALTNWSPNQRMMMFGGGGWGRPPQTSDPYLEFAGDWAWAMFDRTICTHMRGDEALALATARQLADVQPKIEAECARRGFQQQPYYDYQRRNEKKPYLDFLDQLPQLLADLERREKEGGRVSVIEGGLQNITSQTERITALIRDLDLVQARQWSQPGGVDLAEDPIVSALIQEGDPAVEPLLDCMDNDKRLTRSVGFGRDFFRGRTVIPVSSAARVAALSILQAGFGDGTAEMRAYWNKYKGMNLNERCYAILNDDTARSRWLEAAAHLTQSENVTTFPGGYSMTRPPPTNAPARLRGEDIRGKSNPSVSELMARRALEVPGANPNSYDISAACEMGLKLAAWDAKSADPVMMMLSSRCATVMKYSGQNLGALLTKLSLARAQAGDTYAFGDYAAWLPTTSPAQMGFSISEYLEPLKQFPTNTTLDSAAEKMFDDTNSAWSTLPWPQTGSDNPVSSTLVDVPAFRRLIVRELDRKEVCGSISWQSSGSVNYTLNDLHENVGFVYYFPESNQTTNGTSVELRWCDWFALSLASGKHIPPFNPFVPVEKRDAALENIKKLLRQN
jgi:hypothetical protein